MIKSIMWWYPLGFYSLPYIYIGGMILLIYFLADVDYDSVGMGHINIWMKHEDMRNFEFNQIEAGKFNSVQDVNKVWSYKN